MTDGIIKIGQSALEAVDAKVKAMMNNVVNSQTPAYRKNDVVVKSFPMYLDEASNKTRSFSQIPKVDGQYQNQTHGNLLKTGNPTDIAIGGEGYFILQGENQQIYTRDGRFKIDRDGRLVSVSGNYPVLGQGGPIQVIPGSTIDVSESGNIIVDGTISDRLRIATIGAPDKMESLNSTMFVNSSGEDMDISDDDNPRLLQGFTETSNVNIMDEMMEMIFLQRIQGLDTKIVQTRDASLSKAIEMGRPAQ